MANCVLITGCRKPNLAAPGLDDGPELREEVDADPDGEQDLQHQPHIVPAGLIQLHTHCVDAVGHLHATNTLTLLQSVWHNVAGKPSRQISVPDAAILWCTAVNGQVACYGSDLDGRLYATSESPAQTSPDMMECLQHVKHVCHGQLLHPGCVNSQMLGWWSSDRSGACLQNGSSS